MKPSGLDARTSAPASASERTSVGRHARTLVGAVMLACIVGLFLVLVIAGALSIAFAVIGVAWRVIAWGLGL